MSQDNYSIEVRNVNLKKLTEISENYSSRLGRSNEDQIAMFIEKQWNMEEQIKYLNSLPGRINYNPILANCSQHVAVSLIRSGTLVFPSVLPHFLAAQIFFQQNNLSWFFY